MTEEDVDTRSVPPSPSIPPEVTELAEEAEASTIEPTSTPVVELEEDVLSAEAIPVETPEVQQTEASEASVDGTAVQLGGVIEGHATHYGESYNGNVLGCGGVYSSADTTIMAVSPVRYAEWPCGTQVQVCGPAGCIIATRQDACPGCYANLVDLSEGGNALVCGVPSTCRVTLQVVQ